MLHINKKSWHYKLFKISYADTSELSLKPVYTVPDTYNLCDYIKRVLILAPFQILIRCLVFMCLLAFVGFVLYLLASPILEQSLVGCFTVYGLPACFFITWYLIKTVRNRKSKSPNIIYEYYRAKKDKYCPKITFVDQDTETP